MCASVCVCVFAVVFVLLFTCDVFSLICAEVHSPQNTVDPSSKKAARIFSFYNVFLQNCVKRTKAKWRA